MTKKQQIEMVNRAWLYVGEALNNLSHHQYGSQLFELNAQEERGHRTFCFDGVKCGLTVKQSARLFCVKQLADALAGDKMPEIRDVLFLRPSWIMSASLVLNYAKDIKKAFAESGVDMAAVRALDYATLNK